ncbi:MAG: FAD-binding oxidoreductase [Bradymonadaceae bacterium]
MAASPEPPDALRDLNAELDGESRADDLARRLFAQDASIYEQRPAGVVFPACSEDVRRIVEFAGSLDLSLIPRGGGTSLAGQCVGEGLVVDFSRMDRLIEVDEERGRARVQPGIVLDELNRQLVSTGWMFAPDTSTASRCQIGGMIGNNSCGSHSVYYGTTRDHLLEAEVVLADGSVVELAEWSAEEVDRRAERDDRLGCALAQLKREVDEHRELIRERYPRPELLRRNTGYPLDLFVAEDSPDSFPLQEFAFTSNRSRTRSVRRFTPSTTTRRRSN